MSQETETTPEVGNRRADGGSGGLTRRTWTLLFSFALVILLGLIGAAVPVPYVALGPGPTYDTLGAADGKQVISISGTKTSRTTGQLRMTTVSLTDGITLFSALGLWLSGRSALAPREEYFQPGKTKEQVNQENVEQFKNSQSNAEVAALRYLGRPIDVVADQVVQGSPAARGGIKPGDQLVAIGGRQVHGDRDVFAVLRGTKPGQRVRITIQHGTAAARTAEFTLGKRGDRTYGFLGITPIDHADVPFKIDITLADVGGPSAGLAFALAIVDKLTNGNLTGGHHIAGTGEIDGDGNVSPIGGINFKMVAAREAGADTFLVPADNCAEAASDVPDGLRLVKVRSLRDAITKLHGIAAGTPVEGC